MNSCTNCGKSYNTIELNARDVKVNLCVECRYKMATGLLNPSKIGRPSLGETRKISLTLPEEDWDWLDDQARGNRSQLLREMIQQEQSLEGLWINNACLGYAILGAQKIGYSEEQIGKLVRAIYTEFDQKSVNVAKEVYEKSFY